MKSRIGIIVGIVAAFLLVIAGIVMVSNQPTTPPASVTFSDRDNIEAMASQIDFSNYSVNKVNAADASSGQLPEKVKGDKSAPVIIYEFADYACGHCAETNTELNRIYNDYDGRVAIVFRTFILGLQNGVAAAQAANAADIQGYWERYKNILFSEQAIWMRLRDGKLEDYLVKTFKEASDGAGDVDKFIKDMSSAAVIQRIAFDQAAGNSIEVSGTPYLIINGERVAVTDLRTTIDEILKK